MNEAKRSALVEEVREALVENGWTRQAADLVPRETIVFYIVDGKTVDAIQHLLTNEQSAGVNA